MGRGEARRGKEGEHRARTARIIDDPFVCFSTKDFESIAAHVAPPGPEATAAGEETSSGMWKMLMKSDLIGTLNGYISKITCIFIYILFRVNLYFRIILIWN